MQSKKKKKTKNKPKTIGKESEKKVLPIVVKLLEIIMINRNYDQES